MFNTYTYNGVEYNSELIIIIIPIVGEATGAGFKFRRKPRVTFINLEYDINGIKLFIREKEISVFGEVVKYIDLIYKVMGTVARKIHFTAYVNGETSKTIILEISTNGIKQIVESLTSFVSGTTFRNIRRNEQILGTVFRNIKINEQILGTRVISINKNEKVLGIKRFDLNTDNLITGTKRFNLNKVNRLQGSKSLICEKSVHVKGKKDLSPIFLALDIFD